MYQIPELQKYKNLFHAFSQKSDGNMANAISGVVYDFPNVYKNRLRFLKNINADINKSVCMWVTHDDEIVEPSDSVVGVSMKDYQKAIKVDGLVTNKKGIFLFLLIADCIPLIIYDPIKNAVGLIHAGWKGVDLEIAGKAISKFKSMYKSKAKDIIVAIGPCARKESFIKESPKQLNDVRWKDFINEVKNPPVILERSDRIKKRSYQSLCSFQDDKRQFYYVDMVGFCKKQLISEGVKEEKIIDCGIDTVKDDKYFSHYREGNLPIEKQGRFACLVGLTPTL